MVNNDKKIISNEIPLPIKEQRRVLLTLHTANRIMNWGIYASLFTIVASGSGCIIGLYQCTVLVHWFVRIPLIELFLLFMGLVLLFWYLLYRKVFEVGGCSIGTGKPYKRKPDILAYYPRTLRETIHVFFVYIDTYVVSLVVGYLIPLWVLNGILAIGYGFVKLSKGE